MRCPKPTSLRRLLSSCSIRYLWPTVKDVLLCLRWPIHVHSLKTLQPGDFCGLTGTFPKLDSRTKQPTKRKNIMNLPRRLLSDEREFYGWPIKLPVLLNGDSISNHISSKTTSREGKGSWLDRGTYIAVTVFSSPSINLPPRKKCKS